MAKLPIDSRLKIEQEIEDEFVNQGFRKYLGISSLAKPCSRELWYGFRLCAVRKVTARLNRLFGRGHNEEPIIQADFRRIGVIHHSDQKEVEFCSGHGKGHIDDILERIPDAPKTPHLGEYKTHNAKSFKDVKAKGVRLSKPVHYGQMVCYMDKLGLTRGLYVAVNKDTDERYYERISADPALAEKLFKKGHEIITSRIPPKKIGGATWYECKWCDYYQMCHFDEQPMKSCRTCKFIAIQKNGCWFCKTHRIDLAFEQQIQGCGKHEYLEGLVK